MCSNEVSTFKWTHKAYFKFEFRQTLRQKCPEKDI